MPSKARQLAKAMVENPIIEDMVTTPAAIPQTIVTETTTAATAIDANFNYATIDVLPGSANVGDQAFVQSTNRLYIWSGAGWYSIALINSTPTWDSDGQPLATYTLDADSPQDATIINLSASDPEGLPINYTYVTSGQMDSIATISQDSSVFTITPKNISQAPDGGTGSITFRATDGINILPQVSSFTLNFITNVENSNHTVMLTSVVDTSDNNNITDASSNNHTITVNGDTYAGTFSPYRHGGYSTYFDGAGDYIDTGLNNAATDFTFECWVNTTVGGMLMARYASGSALDGFIIDSTSGFPVIQINTNANNLNGTVNLKDGKWHHLAFVRDSNVCKIFVDGVLDVSQTDSEPMQVNANWIIGRHGNASTYYYTGYIRDLRWAAGTVRYTSNFTPPTEPLTTLSGDNLFTCHLPYIVDGSSTPYTMTSYGNVSIEPFSPYDYLEYAAADHGGSVYFDTSDDYLTVPNGSWKTYGSSNFTIECWFYADRDGGLWGDSSTSGVGDNCTVIAELKNFNSVNAWVQVEFRVGSTKYGINPAQGTFKRNAWNHIAFVRNGNTFTVYSNGKDVGNTSQSGSMNTSSNNWAIASLWPSAVGSQFNGHISDFRVSKSARYTTEFTPPTAPLSSTGAELHIKGAEASIIDKSQGANLKLVGNTTGSTTTKFTGAKSIYFDGTGDGIVVPHSDNLNLNGCDWTIEYWFNLPNPGAIRNWTFIQKGDNTTTRPYALSFRIDNSNGVEPRIFPSPNNSSQGQISNNAWQTFNAWHHVAFVRVNSTGVITRYINGTANGTVTSDVATNTEDLYIGTMAGAGDEEGYIQDLRISKGKAHYTANFTPPTASLEG